MACIQSRRHRVRCFGGTGGGSWRGGSLHGSSSLLGEPFWQVWDNAAALKTERRARKTCRTRDQAKADFFDYIECFYRPKRRHSTIGYPVEFAIKAGFA
jgi:transposase InsO family protein